jgi:DnaK suppressor protein
MVNKKKSRGEKSNRLSLIQNNLALLQSLVVKRKGEIMKEVQDLENRWEEAAEPQIEVEERAQAIELTESYTPLDDIERKQLQEIDLALKKMDSGRYGICESCGKAIAMNRLKVVPWARYCRRDAEKEEKVPRGGIPTGVSS